MGTIQFWKILLALTGIASVVSIGLVEENPERVRSVNAALEGKLYSEGRTLNIAHRGARSIAPENTLIAAKKAHQAGADMWETDVQLTEDDELVLIHDDTLERTTDVEEVYPERTSYRVDDFTLEEIKRLDAGSWFVDTDPFGEIESGDVSRSDLEEFSGVRVPTLREGLELTRELGWKVNLELKTIEGPFLTVQKRVDFLVKGVISLVEELGMEKDVMLSSFDHSLVKLARGLSPEIPGAILVKEPESGVVETLRASRAEIYNISGEVLNDGGQGIKNLKKLKEAGSDFKVNVWTVNEPEDLMEVVNSPYVDGVFTDYPDRLASIIDS